MSSAPLNPPEHNLVKIAGLVVHFRCLSSLARTTTATFLYMAKHTM